MSRTCTCHRHKLRPGSATAASHWRNHMYRRISELRATLAPEGIKLEVVLIEHASDGNDVGFVIECDDYENAVDVYSASTASIDVFQRRFLADTVIERQRLNVAY